MTIEFEILGCPVSLERRDRFWLAKVTYLTCRTDPPCFYKMVPCYGVDQKGHSEAFLKPFVEAVIREHHEMLALGAVAARDREIYSYDFTPQVHVVLYRTSKFMEGTGETPDHCFNVVKYEMKKDLRGAFQGYTILKKGPSFSMTETFLHLISNPDTWTRPFSLKDRRDAFYKFNETLRAVLVEYRPRESPAPESTALPQEGEIPFQMEQGMYYFINKDGVERTTFSHG
ncbi:MAG: hypothetical protein J6Y62_01810 [Clostridia bacterium]|nr:hypothetical protein [Clostridia bacterium]